MNKVTITSRIMRNQTRYFLPDGMNDMQGTLVPKKNLGKKDTKTIRRSKTKMKLVKLNSLPVACEDNRDNIIGRRYVHCLMVTLGINMSAIFWSMFAVWNPEQPNVWYDNWQTRASKWIITITCFGLAILVGLIRKLDLKQLSDRQRRRYHYTIALEILLLLIHVPPLRFGTSNEKFDLYNIYGMFKLYLLFELFKINHPLWLRRYEVASSQAKVSGPPVFVGNFFTASCVSLDYDLTSFSIYAACVIISLCTITVYFVERWGRNFVITYAIDEIFSGMVRVPRACHLPRSCNGYVSTNTYRGIKVFIGGVYFMNRALVGWTFGFRLAENSETVDDLLNDVEDFISYRHSKAQLIQTWWRKQRERRLSARGKDIHRNWCRTLVIMRNISLKMTMTKADLMVEMDKTWKDVIALTETNINLVKSNQELKRLLLLFLKRKRATKVLSKSLTNMKKSVL